MQFKDLLRVAVLLIAAEATALAIVTVVAAARQDDTLALIFAGSWWAVAIVVGLVLGRPARAAAGVSKVLAGARTSTTLPDVDAGRIALARLWPVAAFAVVAGGFGVPFPPVAAVATGYALLVALGWRNREAAVTAIEDRDGVCFYVEPSSPFEPIRLVRTPGLTRDREPAGHPPPPPPAGA